MHHACVSLRQNRFVFYKIQHLDLSFKNFCDWHWRFTMAKNVATLNLLIITYIDFDLHIFSWSCIFNGSSLAVEKLKNLSWATVWHNC